MNPLDKLFREKLESGNAPVNPEHLKGFEDMLDKKERRKPVFFWWLGGAGLLATLILVISIMAQGPEPQDHSIGQSESSIDNTAGITELGSRGLKTNSEGVPDEHIPESGPASTNRESNVITQNDINSNTLDEGHVTNINKPALSFDPANKSIQQERRVTYDLSTNKESKPVKKKQIDEVNFIMNADSYSPQKTENQDSDVNRIENSLNTIYENEEVPVRPMVSISNLNNIRWNEFELETRKLQGQFVPHLQPLPIIETSKKSKGIGIRLAAHTKSNELEGSILNGKNAPAFSAGIFFQKELNNSLFIEIDGGFSYWDGGLKFEKQSVIEQAGFGLRSTQNTLTAEKGYFYYAGLGIMKRIRRHQLTAGINAMYLYGMQGHISRYITDDFADPIVENIENTWLVTDGLKRWSGQMKVGYGYGLTSNLAIRLNLHIPVMVIARDQIQKATENHIYNSRRTKMYPEIGLRYSIINRKGK